jgi:hypothetical protein
MRVAARPARTIAELRVLLHTRSERGLQTRLVVHVALWLLFVITFCSEQCALTAAPAVPVARQRPV